MKAFKYLVLVMTFVCMGCSKDKETHMYWIEEDKYLFSGEYQASFDDVYFSSLKYYINIPVNGWLPFAEYMQYAHEHSGGRNDVLIVNPYTHPEAFYTGNHPVWSIVTLSDKSYEIPNEYNDKYNIVIHHSLFFNAQGEPYIRYELHKSIIEGETLKINYAVWTNEYVYRVSK